MNELAKLDALQTALANAEDIQEVAGIRAQMEVIAKVLAPRSVGDRFKGSKGYVKACQVHGDWWSRTENKHPGGRPTKTGKKIDRFITIESAGFKSKMDAKQCLSIADVDFEQDLNLYIDGCRSNGKYPTLGGAYKWWKEINPREHDPPQSMKDGIIIGDFRDVELPDESIDLIFTDPPYSEIELYGDLARKASDWLIPGGLCIAYAGHWALPKVLDAMSKHLSYFWIGGVIHTGKRAYMRKHGIRPAWKPLIFYYKPELHRWWTPFEDLIAGSQEKDLHEWQQSLAEAEYFINILSFERNVILDPMCGSGTTLVAAQNLGRKYMGIDVDGVAVQSAKERLND